MKLHEILNITETIFTKEIPKSVLDATLEFINKEGKIHGHQDGKEIVYAVYGNNAIYGIRNDEKVTSFVTMIIPADKDGFNELGLCFTAEEYRGKKDVQRILWFAKEHDKITFIDSGVQTKAGADLIKSLSKSNRFDIFWYNVKTQEKDVYDEKADTDVSKYRALARKTDWRILIESPETKIYECRTITPGSVMWTMFDDELDDQTKF